MRIGGVHIDGIEVAYEGADWFIFFHISAGEDDIGGGRVFRGDGDGEAWGR